MRKYQALCLVVMLSFTSAIFIASLTRNVSIVTDKTFIFNDKHVPLDKPIKIKVNFVWEPIPSNENPHCLIYDLLNDTYKLTYSEEPDFWFFTSKSIDVYYKNALKIFLSGENTMPDFNKCDYAATFSYINFSDRHFRYDFGFSRGLYKAARERKNTILPKEMATRRFCNFLYGNDNMDLEGVVLRKRFFRLLSKYKHIDSPGKVYNNMPNPISSSKNWQEEKQKFLEGYKFTIAFENSNSDGYTTEKLPDPLVAHSIPIYFGNPKVGLEYNKKAFIHVNDYKSLEDVVKKVIELDNDDDAYMAMLNEPPLLNPEYDHDEGLKNFLGNIIKNGKSYHKNTLGLGMETQED